MSLQRNSVMLPRVVTRKAIDAALEKVLNGIQAQADRQDAVVAWESLEIEFERNEVEHSTYYEQLSFSPRGESYTSVYAQAMLIAKEAL